MKKLIHGAGALTIILGLLAGPAWSDIYIRNKPLGKAVEQNFVLYLGQADLARYFTKEELARCTFDPKTGRVEVDGSPLSTPMLSEGQLVPVVALAEALGFQKKVNRELGITDYNTAATGQAKTAGPAARNTGGADYRLGERRMGETFQKYPRLESHPQLARVEKIGQQIVAVSDMPTLTWNFFVVHAEEPNAFCTGAGWVAVTDALLALKLSDDELAGVMAHEIGHGCRKDLEEGKFNRDQLERYGNDALRLDKERQALVQKQQALLSKAQVALNRSRAAYSSAEASSYLNESNSLVAQAKQLDRPIKKLDKQIEAAVKGFKDKEILLTESVFQRKDEHEADVKGIYYATLAGFSPNGLVDSLKKISQHRSGDGFGQAAYNGGLTHPPVSERIKTLNKVLRDWRDQR